MSAPLNIEVEDLAQWVDAGQAPVIVDVREPWEVAVCRLDQALFIPMGQLPGRLVEIPVDRPVVILCHHGIRSFHVVHWLRAQGRDNAINLRGGIDAWARRIDRQMAIY